jgi:Peptidase A4 family
MPRRWCTPMAGLALAAGALAAPVPAAAASHPARPTIHLIRPAIHGTAPMVVRGRPAHAVSSQNWSGYAAHGATYTKVSASWAEPTGHCTASRTYSSFWVGLDGYNSKTVEQTGTEVDCSGGQARYFGWYEMYPAFPVNFASPVRPGDHVTASVTFTGAGQYTLVLADTTQGWSHTVHKILNGAKNSSAEVITEAPCCTGTGGILPLADFGTVHFSDAAVDGAPMGSASPTKIIMVDGSGRAKDAVSALSGGTAFSVTWLRST